MLYHNRLVAEQTRRSHVLTPIIESVWKPNDTSIELITYAMMLGNVQRCDGVEDCPRLKEEQRSWDETEGCDEAAPVTTPASPVTISGKLMYIK